MHPVPGREVAEREQLLLISGDLGDGLGVLGAVGGGELLDRLLGVAAVFGVADLRQRLAGGRLSGFRVVPDEVEGPGAGGDALVVADPPGSVFPRRIRRAVRVEGSGGYLQRCPEAELVRPGQEQDLVHQPVREGEGGDADPACLVHGQVRLEVGHVVVGVAVTGVAQVWPRSWEAVTTMSECAAPGW
jgi:hypothetical protein